MARIELPAGVSHGTNSGYNAGCHCLQCCDAHTEYQREWRQKRATGWSGFVDAAPVRRHVRKLMKAGASYRAIAVSAGVSGTAVYRVLKPTTKLCQARTAEAVLASSGVLRTDDELYVPAEPARDLLRELKKAGISRKDAVLGAGLCPSSQAFYGKSVLARNLRALEAFARSRGVVMPNAAKVELAPALLATVSAPTDPTLQRAYWRAREGKPVTFTNAQRIAAECGLELAEVTL